MLEVDEEPLELNEMEDAGLMFCGWFWACVCARRMRGGVRLVRRPARVVCAGANGT